MRDNPEGGELDPADVVRRRNSYVLSCTVKKIKEGYDRGSEVGSVHSGRDGEGPVFLLKTEGVWLKRELCERFHFQVA